MRAGVDKAAKKMYNMNINTIFEKDFTHEQKRSKRKRLPPSL